ncbi:MAG: hypothetical protein WCF11_05630, partial [Azonexus sp.]
MAVGGVAAQPASSISSAAIGIRAAAVKRAHGKLLLFVIRNFHGKMGTDFAWQDADTTAHG